MRTRLRDLPRIRATATRMLLLMPAAGIVVTPLTIAYAWATGFSTVPTVVALEIALVVGAIIGATMLARRWAVRDPAPAPLVTAG
ncbi:hypothetical protein [Solwaraspora sp. WMMA2101]|uniref:hypothetical protein n=1 Tax=Solwaraspora sp. WMMA2101 TaxID=3404124 RepID=UPI003B93DB32